MTQILNAKGFPINRSLRERGRYSKIPPSRNTAAGRSFIEVTLLVSLVALVAAVGVTATRKGVQKNMCYAGAGVSGDDFDDTVWSNTDRWVESTETCRPRRFDASRNRYITTPVFAKNVSYPY